MSLLTHRLQTSVTMNAPLVAVWDRLIQVSLYAGWNSIITAPADQSDIERLDQDVRVRLTPIGKPSQVVTVKIVEFVPHSRITWLGHFKNVPWLVDGRHTLAVLPQGHDRTVLLHREDFRGALVPLVKNAFLNRQMRPSFEAFDLALARSFPTASER